MSPGPFDCGPDPTPSDALDCRLYPPSNCVRIPTRLFDRRFSFLFDGVPESVEGAPGSTVTFDVKVQICNDIPVRAWSVGIVARGNIRILSAAVRDVTSCR